MHLYDFICKKNIYIYLNLNKIYIFCFVGIYGTFVSCIHYSKLYKLLKYEFSAKDKIMILYKLMYIKRNITMFEIPLCFLLSVEINLN